MDQKWNGEQSGKQQRPLVTTRGTTLSNVRDIHWKKKIIETFVHTEDSFSKATL